MCVCFFSFILFLVCCPIYSKWSENLFFANVTRYCLIELYTFFWANKNINSIWKSQIENKFYLDEKRFCMLEKWNERSWAPAIQNPTISAKSLKYKLSPKHFDWYISGHLNGTLTVGLHSIYWIRFCHSNRFRYWISFSLSVNGKRSTATVTVSSLN